MSWYASDRACCRSPCVPRASGVAATMNNANRATIILMAGLSVSDGTVAISWLDSGAGSDCHDRFVGRMAGTSAWRTGGPARHTVRRGEGLALVMLGHWVWRRWPRPDDALEMDVYELAFLGGDEARMIGTAVAGLLRADVLRAPRSTVGQMANGRPRSAGVRALRKGRSREAGNGIGRSRLVPQH
jgi:hypothetical protein